MQSVAINNAVSGWILNLTNTFMLFRDPTEEQSHLHIQAHWHLNATSLDTLPDSALELLHRYEGQNAPAPMQTYTSVIISLFSRAQA